MDIMSASCFSVGSMPISRTNAPFILRHWVMESSSVPSISKMAAFIVSSILILSGALPHRRRARSNGFIIPIFPRSVKEAVYDP